MTTLRSVRVHCPVCDEEFEAAEVTSCSYASTDTDLRPHYMGFDPLPHFVWTCPSCGVSAYSGEFTQLATAVRGWIRKGHLGRLQSEAPSRRYTLAARCYERAGAPSLKLANLYLQASWCARQEEDTATERLSQRRALEYFRRALGEGGVSDEERPRVLYLLGELCRRLEEFEAAMTYFDQVPAGEWAELAARQKALVERGLSEITSPCE